MCMAKFMAKMHPSIKGTKVRDTLADTRLDNHTHLTSTVLFDSWSNISKASVIFFCMSAINESKIKSE